MRFVKLFVLVAIVACGGSDSTSPAKAPAIVATISSVQTTSGVTATAFSGSPSLSASGPIAHAPSIVSVINGGTQALSVGASAPMTQVVISIVGTDGYYLLPLSSATTSTQILLSLAQGVAASSLVLNVQAGNNGVYGAVSPVNATLTHVGTGDVQVSVSWSQPSDVDLHVIDPSNQEIFYGSRQSSSGGTLDLDSNAGCGIDNVDNENITWPSGASPSGKYTVRVDYWSSCNVPSSDYVVTVNIAGRPAEIFTGTFTGIGDSGGEGAGTTIATFTK